MSVKYYNQLEKHEFTVNYSKSGHLIAFPEINNCISFALEINGIKSCYNKKLQPKFLELNVNELNIEVVLHILHVYHLFNSRISTKRFNLYTSIYLV